LNAGDRLPEPDAADVVFWDYDLNGESDLSNWKHDSRIVFLVRRQHLTELQETLQGSPASILLKPVDAMVLRTTIEVRRRAMAPDSGSRQSQNDLLQYVLETNLRLQEFDQDRTNFLARAVHDFRAPLTALHGYCGLLVEQRLGPLTTPQKELLERMQQSVKRLSRMASAMFELSVGKQVERKPRLEPVDVEQCVQRALHDILPLVDEKQIALTVQVDRPDMAPLWEGGQIEQVLVNLVENACRFTPRNGSIEVRGYATEDPLADIHDPGSSDHSVYSTSTSLPMYRIDVRDSGPGIEAEHLPYIFEEYTSYSGSRDRSCGGLGLAICRMIISAHGGRVWAESTSEGAVFSVMLPLEDSRVQQNPDVREVEQLSAAAAG